MTIWNVAEWAAWVLSACIAGWLLYDAVMTSKRYSEDFLTHTMEDLGDVGFTEFDGHGHKGARS